MANKDALGPHASAGTGVDNDVDLSEDLPGAFQYGSAGSPRLQRSRPAMVCAHQASSLPTLCSVMMEPALEEMS